MNNTVDTIPYQQLPLKGQFSVFEMENFQSEFAGVPHRHHAFQILWFTKGSGDHVVDFVKYELGDNILFLLRPGQVHQLPKSGFFGYSITFTEQFYWENKHERQTLYDFTTLFDDSQEYAPIHISHPAAESLGKIISLMQSEQSVQIEGSSTSVIKHYLNAFLLLAEREKKHNAANSPDVHNHDARIIQLRRLVEKNFRQEHQAGFYAAHFSLTAKRLNEIAKEAINKTVTDMVHARLILEAKRQLAFSNRNVKEICYELGFEDPAYFSRFFRHHAGISPHEFRESVFK
ncbi:helix-turn-helix domain-containing protein [Chitinophaga deserti]|uniref:helix-turn-helix domain-containing protein n=1 Tax=Chitinophaga deserti TaxID=2164099 RepID=UPI0013005940|nr:helix-turn-helix domain-containing protein [Chitinophaga deserti]